MTPYVDIPLGFIVTEWLEDFEPFPRKAKAKGGTCGNVRPKAHSDASAAIADALVAAAAGHLWRIRSPAGTAEV
ncbi:hypothetical protein AAFF_G00104210 [Aldrovandia affinis]|uniref:Uncharacterized protein n=1 Tax=Aldrovandia affinis TaxID=143900 RepID=A0AAD7T1S5_9TELE|nr:hypothetical protein AAFF_G00104210 [Aldrovandia affinis]